MFQPSPAHAKKMGVSLTWKSYVRFVVFHEKCVFFHVLLCFLCRCLLIFKTVLEKRTQIVLNFANISLFVLLKWGFKIETINLLSLEPVSTEKALLNTAEDKDRKRTRQLARCDCLNLNE